MSATQLHSYLQNHITYEHLADYLTAEHGHDICLWAAGWETDDPPAVAIAPREIRYQRNHEPLARVPCPGIGNLDSTEFTRDFCDEDVPGGYGPGRNERGDYVENGSGRVIGDLADVIRECCQDGDMSEYMDDLIAALERSARE
jgi:hypothetical protein